MRLITSCLLVACGLATPLTSLAQSCEDLLIDTTRVDALDSSQVKKLRQNDRQSLQSALPFYTYRVHNNNKFWNTVTNDGSVGNNGGYRDVINRSRLAPSFRYPFYTTGSCGRDVNLWVGGIIGNDTLVTTTGEFLPGPAPDGDFEDLAGNSDVDFGDLISRRAEQVYRCEYTDTNARPTLVPYDRYDGRFHKLLKIKVTQTSYTWAYTFAEDFMIVDYVIDNLSGEDIEQVWLGVAMRGPVLSTAETVSRSDDVEGYIASWPFEYTGDGVGARPDERMWLTWMADNDGQPTNGRWLLEKMQHVAGIAPMALPPGARRANFNWWTTDPYNWGPRLRATQGNPFRPYPEGVGVPHGDKARYSMLSKAEVDYEGYRAGINFSRDGWLAPHPNAALIADGHSVNTLSSFGPVTIPANGQTRLTVAISMGELFHTDPTMFKRRNSEGRPHAYLNHVDFTDLVKNVRMARTIYDNPGVDTDGDGYAGEIGIGFDTITGEYQTVYFSGDGYPDFKGAGPPPVPAIRVTSGDGTITVRWNGRASENTLDQFSNSLDFEGYRVWIARTLNEQEWSRVSSYDRENYNRYRWANNLGRYVLLSTPLTLDSLRKLYGPTFDPKAHPGPGFPHFDRNEIFYFVPVDYNQSSLTTPRGIRKVYPDAIKDTSDVDSEGRMRYYEYECTIDGLLSTVPYFVGVTTFDHGSKLKGIDPLESSPIENAHELYPRASGDSSVLKEGKLNVYIYPNSYRLDADYDEHGYENRQTYLADDRARSIWFANLPDKRKISVFSIDGDRIREMYHDEPPGSGNASIARFDLITRNRNALVSGLYYWVVESEHGTQMGKLVVIK